MPNLRTGEFYRIRVRHTCEEAGLIGILKLDKLVCEKVKHTKIPHGVSSDIYKNWFRWECKLDNVFIWEFFESEDEMMSAMAAVYNDPDIYRKWRERKRLAEVNKITQEALSNIPTLPWNNTPWYDPYKNWNPYGPDNHNKNGGIISKETLEAMQQIAKYSLIPITTDFATPPDTIKITYDPAKK